MSLRTYRLQLRDVLQAHEASINIGGGLLGIRDLGLVESAIGRPYNGYYRFIHNKAAALLESLVKNHGFIDGNKRTTFIAVNQLLNQSGYLLEGLQGDADQELEDLIVGVADNQVAANTLAGWFKDRIVKI